MCDRSYLSAMAGRAAGPRRKLRLKLNGSFVDRCAWAAVFVSVPEPGRSKMEAVRRNL
jgi:hypothetical protein